MMIFSPMWQNEVERMGFERCSRLAAWLRALSDYYTLIAIILLLISVAGKISAWCGVLLWLAGRMMCIAAYRIAERRQFQYDDENRIATWRNADGGLCRYTYQDYEREREE